jgi:hypothetical protein
MFRRRCFDDIRGYHPVRGGGIDTIAEVMARMHGWKVRAFEDIQATHNRLTGSELRGRLGACFHQGFQDYLQGYHPVFFIGRCGYRSLERPYLLGGLLLFAGYAYAFARREPRQVPDDFVLYLRGEQLGRLRRLWSGVTSRTGPQ